MASEEDAAISEEKRHRRFCLAVESFIDLYKFIMVLAIGNCVRCLAQRQIQPNVNAPNGLQLNLFSVSLHDTLMFVMVMIFISRFFLGDLAYWKSYTQRNQQIQVTDALNLLINAFFLTYMSFFIGYTWLIGYMIFFLLIAELVWGIFRRVEGRFRTTEGPLSMEINLGLALSALTIIIVLIVVVSGGLPAEFPGSAGFSESQNWTVFWILCLNNVADLFINGGRYLGINEKSWWTVRLNVQRNHE